MPLSLLRPGCLALVFSIICATPTLADPLAFHVTFDKKAHAKPFTGRVYVMLFKRNAPVLAAPAWFGTEPFFALDVKNVKPGETIVFDKNALAFPVPLNAVPAGKYTVQAVMDVAHNSRHFTTGPGNVYTIKTGVDLDPKTSGTVKLTLDKVYKAREFKETERVKLVDIESKLLTRFHGRSTHLRAGVILPESYAKNPKKSYPVIYDIPGFGGNHFMAMFYVNRKVTDVAGTEMIYVVLDPDCHHGHHVFADSANNGPVGKALTTELIPAIEKKFRAIAKPGARLLTGHSSGGWSSLWLQVAYPDFFGGVWSTSPDPVDFRDFQQINLYRKGENMFTDAKGDKRPIARARGKAILFYKPFSDMEVVFGHGGQLRSFEAVFSERGKDGQPKKLWDRKTGAIDPEVARSWEKYDIRLILERDWKTLGPKLKGKIHVYMGDADTFYLEGATKLLKASLEKLKSDAVVELFKDRDHGLVDRALRERIQKEMAARVKAAKVVD